MCMKIDKIIKINKRHGGVPLTLSNLDFALEKANREKNPYKKSSHLIRGIVQGHPFLDGNKSTAIEVSLRIFSKHGINCNKKEFKKGILKIAQEKNTPLIKIERRLRKWCKKK